MPKLASIPLRGCGISYLDHSGFERLFDGFTWGMKDTISRLLVEIDQGKT